MIFTRVEGNSQNFRGSYVYKVILPLAWDSLSKGEISNNLSPISQMEKLWEVWRCNKELNYYLFYQAYL